MNANPALESPRLRLEPQTAAHADEMFAVLADPALYAHEGGPPPSPAWLRERFARLESRTSGDGSELWLNWVLRTVDGGEAIGYVQATVGGDGRALVAYVLGSRWWGRGLAGEAVRTMIDALQRQHRVAACVAVLKRDNLRSLRLLQRLGFEPAADADAHGQGELPADECALLLRLPAHAR